MTHADINGLARYSGKKNNVDLTVKEFLLLLESQFPGAGLMIVERYGGGQITVPKSLTMPVLRAMTLDDGVMSIRELAGCARVGIGTAHKARKSRVYTRLCSLPHPPSGYADDDGD
jgi:hypothetical protein